jgi:Family of unknown function (DUF5330)
MKILRGAIYLGVLAFLLPSPPPEDVSQKPASLGVASTAAAPSASGGDLFAAAVGAVDDVSGFCTRQPLVCDTAHTLVLKLEAKAKYGLRLLYRWAETPEQRPAASTEAALGDPITTSAVTIGRESPASDALVPADLLPKWRAPRRSGAG